MKRISYLLSIFIITFNTSCKLSKHIIPDSISQSQTLDSKESIKNEIDKIANKLIKSKYNIGLVVAVLHNNETNIYTYGYADKSKKNRMNENTIIGIGSNTKMLVHSVGLILEAKGIIDFDETIGEILPKTITRKYANYGLLMLSPFLKLSYYLLLPIVLILRQTGWMSVSERFSGTDEELEEKRDDIQHAYEQVDDPEAIESDQKEMISNVFDFRESSVYEAMTPRTEISAISNTDSLEKVLHTFIDSGHSKLPVYEKDLDNIIGVVYLYELFHTPENLQEVIKPVLFVPYSKPVMDLMGEFQTAHHALAIVLDEHGGTAGLITAEDVFEELFGDFEDEFDEDEVKSEMLEDGSIIVNARLDWEDFNTKFGNMIPQGEYETLGGYIISQLGRIPNQGEHLFLPIGQVVVKKGSSRQIHQVKIYPSE